MFWNNFSHEERERCIALLRKQRKYDMHNARLKKNEEHLKIFLLDEEYIELDRLSQKGWHTCS